VAPRESDRVAAGAEAAAQGAPHVDLLAMTALLVPPRAPQRRGELQPRHQAVQLRQLVRLYLKRADRVIAIGETMRTRLEEKGAPPDRLRVIPNWVDTARLGPLEKANPWARNSRLDEKFVVMHSGNVGHAQDLDNLIRATTFLRDVTDLTAVIVGFGARYADHVALAAQLDADAVRFLPYQPRDVLAQSLSSADVHFIGLGRGLSGYVVPSRFYGVLAAGRPVITAADEDSEAVRVVRAVGCGIAIAPGRPDELARTIRALIAGEYDLAEMGRRGREYVEAEADRDVAIARYRSVLDEVRE